MVAEVIGKRDFVVDKPNLAVLGDHAAQAVVGIILKITRVFYGAGVGFELVFVARGIVLVVEYVAVYAL